VALLRYTEDDVRHLLMRAIPIRWPRERALFMTRCQAEQVALRPDGVHSTGGAGSSGRTGFVAATQHRLVYEDRTPRAALFRGIAVALGFVGACALLFGNSLSGFFGLGLAASVVWLISQVAETILAGNRALEYERVSGLDPASQRIEGSDGGGITYRLLIPDPSDFRMIASLVMGHSSEQSAA
jgi:hypothetical protein